MQENKDRIFFDSHGRGDFTSAAIAFILSLLIHVLIFTSLPLVFKPFDAQRKSADEELSIEILPLEINRRKPDFVEANPYGNSDIPPADSPESFKNQRAADVLTDANSKSKMPYVEGEIKNGRKIVSGTSAPEDVLSPEDVMEVVERPLVQPARPQDVGAPEKAENKSSDGNGTESATGSGKKSDDKKESKTDGKSADGNDGKSDDEKSEREKSDAENGKLRDSSPLEDDSGDAKDPESIIKIPVRQKTADSGTVRGEPDNAKSGSGNKTSQASRKKAEDGAAGRPEQQAALRQAEKRQEAREESVPAPKPRPQLSMKIPAGPLADNRSHASRQGQLAVDSRFSEYGAYQQRMIEAISRQWNLLGSQYDLGTAVGTQVVIEYWLNTKGELTRHKILFSNSTNTGRGLCEQSILTTAPYGEWTRDMINTLGSSDQSVTITFHYR